ncbi:hypothetical protein GGI04_003478, partial [Coemansia thaxteri]
MTKPLVVVFGATGNQGGSILRVLAEHPNSYTVRAITRSTQSKSAQELAAQYPHVEWVEADLDDSPSLLPAVADADVVFAVTQFFQPSVMAAISTNENAEFEQGKRIVDACVAKRVGYLIFSTLPSAKKLSNGEITTVLHFEGKAKIQEYMLSQPIDSAIIQMGIYFQNNLQGARWDDAEDSIVIGFPGDVDKKLAYVDVNRDTGPFVKYIIDNRDKAKGKVFPVCSGYYSARDIAEALTKATGLKAKAIPVPLDIITDTDLRGMFELFSKYELFADTPNHMEVNKAIP